MFLKVHSMENVSMIFGGAEEVSANQPAVHSKWVIKGGYVDLAVGISNRWQITYDTLRMKHDKWRMIFFLLP